VLVTVKALGRLRAADVGPCSRARDDRGEATEGRSVGAQPVRRAGHGAGSPPDAAPHRDYEMLRISRGVGLGQDSQDGEQGSAVVGVMGACGNSEPRPADGVRALRYLELRHDLTEYRGVAPPSDTITPGAR